MGKIILKKTQVFFLALLFILVMNIVSRAVMRIIAIPTFFTIDLFIIMIMLFPIYLFKQRLYTIIYSSVIVFFFCFLFMLNLTYYFASNTPFYLGLLKYLGEAKEVVTKEFIEWWIIAIGLAFEIVYLFANKFIDKYYKYPNEDRFYIPFGFVFTLLGILISFAFISGTASYIYKRNKSLDYIHFNNGFEVINYHTKYLKVSSYTSYGMLGSYLSEYSITWGNGSSGEITYNNDPIYSSSEYTGLLEGYNIFTIMVETGIYETITEEFTPNLYYLQSNGINCTNNYSKNKTSSSEIIGFVGSYPIETINYDYEHSHEKSIYKLKINIPSSMPELLKNTYATKFFHDGMGLYARNSLMGQFGFESYRHEYWDTHPAGSSAWDFDGSYELDSDYIDIVLDDMMIKDEPFYTYWTTLSTHGPYVDVQNDEVSKRDALFEEMGYIDKFDSLYNQVYYDIYGKLDNDTYKAFRHLICAFMNLDEAVGKIMDKAKELGVYDKTIFVVYGDHEAYYQKLSKALTHSSYAYDVVQYHTTLFFYNEKLNSTYRTKNSNSGDFNLFVSPYVIVPTLLDLLGINYNEQLYFSPSIFRFKNEFDGIFYSSEYSAFMTNVSYSSSITEFEYISKDITIDQEAEIVGLENEKLLKLLYIDSLYSEWLSYGD